MRIACIFIVLMLSFPAFANSTCPYSEGNVVQFKQAAPIIEKLYDEQLVKDEFETLAEFQNRVQTEKVFEDSYLFEGELNNIFVKYDSEKSRYNIEFAAFGIGNDGLYEALETTHTHSDIRKTFGDTFRASGVELPGKSNGNGDYIGTNAFGAKAAVSKVSETRFFIYDPNRSVSPLSMWVPEFELAPYRYAVGFPSKPDTARLLKNKLRVGFYFEPSKDIVLRGLKFEEPTITNPVDREVFFKTIVGSIPCAVITNEIGSVLKIVESIAPKP